MKHPCEVTDMAAWRAAHLRPVSWYGVFYGLYSTNLRFMRAWWEFWR